MKKMYLKPQASIYESLIEGAILDESFGDYEGDGNSEAISTGQAKLYNPALDEVDWSKNDEESN